MCLPPAVAGIALCLLQTKHRQPGLPPRPCGVTRLQPGRLLGCPPDFNDSIVHLAGHDVTLCAVSRVPLAKLQAYKRRMG
jgi:hypothetical protein